MNSNDSLSSGFCREVLRSKFSKSELDALYNRWNQVHLQVVDIQRFPQNPSENELSRFYLIASDGDALLFLVVPPQTEMEDNIAQFQLDVGSEITLHHYIVLEAENRKNVIVPLHLSFSPNPVPLVGAPQWDVSLFTLSPKALLHRQPSQTVPDIEQSLFGGYTDVTIQDMVREPRSVLNPWQIELCLVWVAPPHRVGSGGDMVSPVSASDRHRYTVKTVGMDHNGHAILCLFFGSLTWIEKLTGHLLWRLANGSVVWEPTVEGIPSHLSFNEQCVFYPLSSSDAVGMEQGLRPRHRHPREPVSVVGLLAGALPSVSEIIDVVPLDRVVSFVGFVVSFRSGVLTHTKRGSTLRSNVIVADPLQRLSTIDVTLWGDLSTATEFQKGCRYWFHHFTLREFQHRKTLSSRGDSLVLSLAEELSFPVASITEEVKEDARLEEVENQPNVLFVLQLNLSTQVLPVLCRIQEIELPLVAWQCSRCRFLFAQRPIAFVCPQCGNLSFTSLFRTHVTLSDGVEQIYALCQNSAAEKLFEISIDSFERSTHTKNSDKEMRSRLTGCPILAWLLKLGSSSILTNCQHIDFSTCSTALLSSVEGFLQAA